jgi:hypothetical protein
MRPATLVAVFILLCPSAAAYAYDGATVEDRRCDIQATLEHCRTYVEPAPAGVVVAPYAPPGTILICAGTDCRAVPAPQRLPHER